jgi:transglutaminase-like putative cysteine protease
MVVNATIPRTGLIWVLSVMVLLILPHLSRMPIWLMILALVCLTWRWQIYRGRADYPGRIIRAGALLAVGTATVLQYGGDGLSIDGTVILLISGCLLKLLEMRYRRDIYIVNTLAFLLLMAGFIYSQSILSGIYNLLIALLILASLISLNRAPEFAEGRAAQLRNLRMAGVIMLQAMPLMLVLFVTVPRISPLWAVSQPSNVSSTGVSDRMTPGEISELARSTEIAFRVEFADEVPLPDQLYWRGLALEEFDGTTWSRNYVMVGPRQDREYLTDSSQDPLEYNIIMEPSQQNWLYAISVPQVSLPGVFLDNYNTLNISRPVVQRLRYDVRSYINAPTDLTLGQRARARSLRLPEEGNPRARELATQMRAQYTDDRQLAAAMLERFRTEEYFYTLYPPLLGADGIDEFLFDSRQGFCEHYAGALTFMLRAAGIPARVVVGYQGAEPNRFDDYLIVYQYNAHAWVEAWFDGEGWRRLDPTAWVAPERIEQGAEILMRQDEQTLQDPAFAMLLDRPWLNAMRLRLDSLEYSWSRWVLSYDEATQLQFLEQLVGASRVRWLPAIMVMLVVLMLSAVVFGSVLTGRRRRDPIIDVCLDFMNSFAGTRLERLPGEGAQTYFHRLAAGNPLHREALELCAREINRLIYDTTPDPKDAWVKHELGQLSQRLKQLRRQLARNIKTTQT